MTTSASELLQKVFKTLADPTRIRILRLLEQQSELRRRLIPRNRSISSEARAVASLAGSELGE